MGRPRKNIDSTFAEALGSEANQHAKALAQEKSKKQKEKFETYYTVKGSKIIAFKVKPTGVYNDYIGNLNKKGESVILKMEIEKWKKQGLWIEPHAVKEFCQKKMEVL